MFYSMFCELDPARDSSIFFCANIAGLMVQTWGTSLCSTLRGRQHRQRATSHNNIVFPTCFMRSIMFRSRNLRLDRIIIRNRTIFEYPSDTFNNADTSCVVDHWFSIRGATPYRDFDDVPCISRVFLNRCCAIIGLRETLRYAGQNWSPRNNG